MKPRAMTLLARLLRDRTGGALIELAAVAPVLVLLTMGGVEVARLALLHQKLDRVAASLGDLVSQADGISAAQVDQLFAAVAPVAWPFTLGADGVVIVTSLGEAGGAVQVNWQRQGGGTLAENSAFGAAGATATLPDGLVMRSGDTLIAAEVWFDFRPVLFAAVAPPARLYHRALFRPRLGALTTLN